jgi:hypothetical protein
MWPSFGELEDRQLTILPSPSTRSLLPLANLSVGQAGVNHFELPGELGCAEAADRAPEAPALALG